MTVEELLARCELVRASEKRLTECQPFSCGESAAMMEYKPATSSEPTARGRRCSKTVKQNYRNYEY